MSVFPDLINTYYTSPHKLFPYFRKGALLDSQMLKLLLVGLSDLRKGTEYLCKVGWTGEDFDNLSRFIGLFKIKKFIITPHTLTDFVHDIYKKLGKDEATKLIKDSSNYLKSETLTEIHIKKNDIVDHIDLNKFGISDLSVSICHSKEDIDCILCKNRKLRTDCQEVGKLSIDYNEDMLKFFQTFGRSG